MVCPLGRFCAALSLPSLDLSLKKKHLCMRNLFKWILKLHILLIGENIYFTYVVLDVLISTGLHFPPYDGEGGTGGGGGSVGQPSG